MNRSSSNRLQGAYMSVTPNLKTVFTADEHTNSSDRPGSFYQDADYRSSISVLVIEDDYADFLLLERTFQQLESYEADLYHAPSLERAREILMQRSFDLAIVDFWLGLDTGVRVLNEIGGRAGHLAAILLTGVPGHYVKQSALKAGAICCIDKNQLTPSLLENTIRSTLHTHRIEQKIRATVVELELANRTKSE